MQPPAANKASSPALENPACKAVFSKIDWRLIPLLLIALFGNASAIRKQTAVQRRQAVHEELMREARSQNHRLLSACVETCPHTRRGENGVNMNFTSDLRLVCDFEYSV